MSMYIHLFKTTVALKILEPKYKAEAYSSYLKMWWTEAGWLVLSGFTSECEQNANAACENEAIVYCRRVAEMRQTAFGCGVNVWRTVKHYPLNVATSKGIRIHYVYVGFVRCLGECRTMYKCTIPFALPRFRMCCSHSHLDVNPAYMKIFLVFFCNSHTSLIQEFACATR